MKREIERNSQKGKERMRLKGYTRKLIGVNRTDLHNKRDKPNSEMTRP
jgi:hypothetical protein